MKKLLLIIFLVPNIALYELEFDEYQANKSESDKQLHNLYIAGIASGFMYANAELSISNKELLYCQPTALILTNQNLINMIDDQIEANYEFYKKHNMKIQVILLSALMRTFPC